MKKLWKNTKGAVTVIVTLLLIPALLVTGSGVDLARIYAAQSIVQNGNQMGLNAAMTQYDALLQDIYGLFAVAKSDTELNTLVTQYVNASIYGSGTFPLISGSGNGSNPTITSTQNLGQVKVLRHQIEEYAKYRVPVALGSELLERLKSFDTMKKASEIAEDKLEIDEQIGDLMDEYKKLYEKINAVNDELKGLTSISSEINTCLGVIKTELQKLKSLRDEYTRIFDGKAFYRDEMLADIETKYNIVIANINSIIKGRYDINSWYNGYENDEGEWISAKKWDKASKGAYYNLNNRCSRAVTKLNKYASLLDSLVTACKNLDASKASLQTKLNALEQKIKTSKVDADFSQGIQSDIREYRKLLGYDCTAMAEAMRSKHTDAIDNLIQRYKSYNNLCYGVNYNYPISMSNLKSAGSVSYLHYDVVVANRSRGESQKVSETRLGNLAYLSSSKYSYSNATMYKFQDDTFSSTGNPAFYSALEKIAQATNNDTSKQVKQNISTYIKNILAKFDFDFRPQGAGYYRASSKTETNNVSSDWSDTSNDGTLNQATKAFDLVQELAGLADDVTDKVLLVGYASEMFSCYTTKNTAEEESNKKQAQTSLSGIPLDTNINYFYQSELEYLYHGKTDSAAANLAAVSGTILMVRFVFNYISTFSNREVTEYIQMIRGSCSAIPVVGTVVGVLLGELARIAFALGESALDIGILRSGDAVPLMKNDQTWMLGLTNLSKTIGPVEAKSGTNNSQVVNGITYRDYLRIFLLLTNGDTIANRVRFLIQLNMTNASNNLYGKGEKIYGNESKMSSATLYSLDSCSTAFQVDTTVELRFLFLSMAFAQKGVNGVVPSSTVDISVTDYRGY